MAAAWPISRPTSSVLLITKDPALKHTMLLLLLLPPPPPSMQGKIRQDGSGLATFKASFQHANNIHNIPTFNTVCCCCCCRCLLLSGQDPAGWQRPGHFQGQLPACQ
jgi:hypothetical protein